MSKRKEEFLEWVNKFTCSEILDEVKKILQNNDNPTDSEMKMALRVGRARAQNKLNGSIQGSFGKLNEAVNTL